MRGKENLSLQFFITRSMALSQYRKYVRCLGRIQGTNPSLFAELHERVRQRFQDCREERDPKVIKQMLNEGTNYLKEIRLLVDSAQAAPNPHSQMKKGDTWIETEGFEEEKIVELSSTSSNEIDDVKGRLGTGWPWSRSSSSTSSSESNVST